LGYVGFPNNLRRRDPRHTAHRNKRIEQEIFARAAKGSNLELITIQLRSDSRSVPGAGIVANDLAEGGRRYAPRCSADLPRRDPGCGPDPAAQFGAVPALQRIILG
jgi:hypothetical protein